MNQQGIQLKENGMDRKRNYLITMSVNIQQKNKKVKNMIFLLNVYFVTF